MLCCAFDFVPSPTSSFFLSSITFLTDSFLQKTKQLWNKYNKTSHKRKNSLMNLLQLAHLICLLETNYYASKTQIILRLFNLHGRNHRRIHHKMFGMNGKILLLNSFLSQFIISGVVLLPFPTGQLLPTVEAKVVDLDSGESLPPNQKGEIYLRSRCVSLSEKNETQLTSAVNASDISF